MTGFESRQLVNPFYLKERTEASFYLLKNIIFDSGIHLKTISDKELQDLIEISSQKYGLDKELLTSFTSKDNQFYISFSGGMGLTLISPRNFKESGFKDPFSAKQNLEANLI